MNQEKIGKFIKELREEKRITQDELGEILNISGKSVSKWERGLSLPDISNLQILADTLNISVSELLMGERSNNKKISNESYVKGLNLYSKKISFKYLKLIIVLILLFIASFLFFYFWNEYGSNSVYKIESADPAYSVKGYFIINKEMNILMIEKVKYQGDKIGTKEEPIINKSNISFYKDNKSIISVEYEVSKKIPYNEFLKQLSFTRIYNLNKDDKIIKDNKYYLSVECNYDKEYDKQKIPLKLTQIYSNDKIFY